MGSAESLLFRILQTQISGELQAGLFLQEAL